MEVIEPAAAAAPRGQRAFQLYPHPLGLTYTIESSTHLNFWTALTRFVATNVPMDVVDLTASNLPARFYRAVSP